jgi:hypothetical protein
MGSVAQFPDPEGDDLIRRAELAGGAEHLTEGERWRLENTLRRQKMHEAAAAQPRVTDALSAQRIEAVESRLVELKSYVDETLPEVIGTVIGEAKHDAVAEAEKAIASLRDEINAKSDAQFDAFEKVVEQLRGEDRVALLRHVGEVMSEAEGRIDGRVDKALQAIWERAELEIALVRDEVLGVVSEKIYARPVDDDCAKLAEKAIAGLRRRMSSLEKEGARQGAKCDQLAGVAERVAALEEAYRESTKNLLIRLAASALAGKKETERADGLVAKVERLEAEFERLTGALLDQKVIR